MHTEQFIAYLEHQKRYSKHTVAAYRVDLNQYAEYLGSVSSTDLEAGYHQVRDFMAVLLREGTEPVSVARKISALRSYYKFLLRGQHITANPMTHIRVPKKPKKLPVFIGASTLEPLLNNEEINGEIPFDPGFSGQRDKLVLELLFGTGMRLAELVALKESDINRFQLTIKVMGKRNKERIVPMAKPLMAEIEHYLTLKRQNFNNNTDKLIVTDKGDAAYPKLIYRIVNTYLGKVVTSDKKSPHVLRHSYATSLLDGGADLNAIKELLGHAGLAATQVYVHNSVERLKAIYKQAHPKA